MDEEDKLKYPLQEPKKEELERIVSLVRSQIKMSLIGIDIIIENETGRYAIIDMNTFPGRYSIASDELFCIKNHLDSTSNLFPSRL